VSCVGSIAEIDAAAWDSLATNDVYARHGWLLSLEQNVADAADPVYFLLESDDALVGAAACYRFHNAYPSPVDALLLGRLAGPAARLGIRFGPVLACMPLIGHGRHLLWRDDDRHPNLVIRALLDAVAEHARTERLSLAFAKLPDTEEALLAALAARGFSGIMNWPLAYIDICWDTFEEYLSSLAPGVANKVRREYAAPPKAGVSLREEISFAKIAEELFALVEANHRLYSHEPLGIAPGLFTALARLHKDNSVVTVARTQDKISGAALLLSAGNCAGGPLIGVSSDDANRKAFAYFNLAFYAPIRWCIEHGINRLFLGAGLYDMKRRRGCSMLGLTMSIQHRTASGRMLWNAVGVLHRYWAAAKLRRQNPGTSHST
jgi:uncharacterized protein